MSRRCIGYEGEGKLRRPIWDTPLDPVPLPANPPGAIERRQLSEEELAAVRSAEPVRCLRSITHFPTPEDRQRAQASRMNGARRHVEVVAARRPKEESVMASDPDPVMEPTPLERLAAAAQTAHSAHEDKQVADEAWAEAQRALTIAWRDLPASHLDWELIGGASRDIDMTDHGIGKAVPKAAPIIPDSIPEPTAKPRQPGHHGTKANERRERDERATRVLEAMDRLHGDQAAVAQELGMRANAVAMVVKHARLRAGEQPG